MKFSVNWLREFVDLPTEPEEIADLLTRAGVETEHIETRGAKIDKVIVSQITASARHPNADRLSVCEVDDGSGTKRQIVCGASNYKEGDKVPLALPGAKLPNGTEIRKSKLRGVESEGMLCSAIELGLGADAAGLLILSPEAKIGAPISDLFPSDTILDVEITPNRGDLLSHYGLAREIGALTGKSVTADVLIGKKPPGTAASRIKITSTRECPFFSAREIDNVTVGPSPQWLRAKIESVGIRSINNIVDISNFVMLELGQPTHAFDADKLRGDINVRLARDGEKFLALDGKTYSLKKEMCVVADQERAVGIGGVMGGEETGVSNSTKSILLEAAYFLPASIRKTARELSLPSDASYRFERGVDPEMILRASQRATELIQEIAGGSPAKEINVAGKLPENPAEVSLSYEKCDRVIGVSIEPKTVDQILEGFGLAKTKSERKSGSAEWQIPSYRRDLQRDVDLVEEVVRAFGAEKIPGSYRSRFTATTEADRFHDLESAWRNRLAAAGLNEVRTSKLLPRERFAFAESAIELRNPLSEEAVALRPSILAGLLAVLDRNVRAGAGRVAIFEIGRTFIPPAGKEERHLGVLLWGNTASAADWRAGKSRNLDLFDLKGALESVVPKLSFRSGKFPELALAVDIYSGDRKIGFGGQLSSAKSSAPGSVFIAELHADLLLRDEIERKFSELEKFPAVSRDIAMIVSEEIPHEKILHAIENPKEPLLESVELFDLFTDKVGESRKSLAYRLTYRSQSRTLTSEEVNAAHAKIRERLRSDLGAELRE